MNSSIKPYTIHFALSLVILVSFNETRSVLSGEIFLNEINGNNANSNDIKTPRAIPCAMATHDIPVVISTAIKSLRTSGKNC
jgi:hypothetical protein